MKDIDAIQRKKEYDKIWQSTHAEKMREYNRRSYLKKKKIRESERGLVGRCGMGRKYELLALDLLPGSIDCNTDSFHGKYDIIWNNKKIDVKSSEWRSKDNAWQFRLSNTEYQDALLLFCLECGKVVKVLLVPINELSSKENIFIGMGSKYDKYGIKYLI